MVRGGEGEKVIYRIKSIVFIILDISLIVLIVSASVFKEIEFLKNIDNRLFVMGWMLLVFFDYVLGELGFYEVLRLREGGGKDAEKKVDRGFIVELAHFILFFLLIFLIRPFCSVLLMLFSLLQVMNMKKIFNCENMTENLLMFFPVLGIFYGLHLRKKYGFRKGYGYSFTERDFLMLKKEKEGGGGRRIERKD